MNRTKLLKSLTLVAGVMVSAGAMAAKPEYTLKLSHMLPPMSLANTTIFEPWAKQIEKDSNGRIKIDVYPAMQLGGKPPQLFDQVRKGIVDIAWTVAGYTPGRFPKMTVFELPFMPASAKATSMALQEYAQKEMKKELKDVHLLAVHTHAPGSLHSRSTDIKTLADLKDLAVRAPNKVMSEGFSNIGANTVFMPVTEMPSALSKGVIDVAVLPYEVVLPMKIYELATHNTDLKGPRGLYTNTFIFAMNKKVYDSMPPDLQKVIDKDSGMQLAAHIGAMFDKNEKVGRDAAVKAGNTFNYIEGAEYDKWEKAFAPITADWVKNMDKKGYNGERLLKEARTLIKKYENE